MKGMDEHLNRLNHHGGRSLLSWTCACWGCLSSMTCPAHFQPAFSPFLSVCAESAPTCPGTRCTTKEFPALSHVDALERCHAEQLQVAALPRECSSRNPPLHRSLAACQHAPGPARAARPFAVGCRALQNSKRRAGTLSNLQVKEHLQRARRSRAAAHAASAEQPRGWDARFERLQQAAAQAARRSRAL